MARMSTRLAAARTQRGLTQKELSKLAGRSCKEVSLIENGHRQPSLETLRRLIAALAGETPLGHDEGIGLTEAILCEIMPEAAKETTGRAEHLASQHPRSDLIVGRRDHSRKMVTVKSDGDSVAPSPTTDLQVALAVMASLPPDAHGDALKALLRVQKNTPELAANRFAWTARR